MTSDSAYDQLNERQQRFVDEYLRDPNATTAALAAGYSPKTARFMSAENLTKPHIKAASGRSGVSGRGSTLIGSCTS